MPLWERTLWCTSGHTLLSEFPPVVLIQPPLEWVLREGLPLILVIPRWPRKPWFIDIIHLLGEDLWKLLLPVIPGAWEGLASEARDLFPEGQSMARGLASNVIVTI